MGHHHDHKRLLPPPHSPPSPRSTSQSPPCRFQRKQPCHSTIFPVKGAATYVLLLGPARSNARQTPAEDWTCVSVIPWDGCTPLAIIDDEDRIIAVLVGRPVGDDWPHVVAGLEAAINQLGKAAKFTAEECDHRRGPLPAMDFGVSHGGGQKRPSVLKQGSEQNQHAIDAFCADPNVIRAAGFADSGFACYAPKMYQRYSQCFTTLRKSDPSLKWNFPKSIFASATANTGPAAASYDHLDYSNAAAGWCSITSAGTFDPKKGGHLILFDINKVVEFPSGSTILIPSSVMRHGNTPIQEGEGETRVSMTQYSAGALFRWVDNGCIKQDDTSKAHKAYMAATAPERFTKLLDLFSTLDSLAADRLSVFGK